MEPNQPEPATIVPEEGVLNPIEVRVLGSLVEKQITTPDYYPLTLNALTNASNQTSNRDPVMALNEHDVVRALESLRDKKLAFLFAGAQSRVPKYGNRFAEAFELDKGETALICELMVRGPQTVGELRGRAARMHEFESLGEVEAVLEKMAARTRRALVCKLARQPGMKESRYAQLLGGAVEVDSAPVEPSPEAATLAVRAENERVARLEAEVAALRQEIGAVKAQVAEFRKQFE